MPKKDKYSRALEYTGLIGIAFYSDSNRTAYRAAIALGWSEAQARSCRALSAIIFADDTEEFFDLFFQVWDDVPEDELCLCNCHLGSYDLNDFLNPPEDDECDCCNGWWCHHRAHDFDEECPLCNNEEDDDDEEYYDDDDEEGDDDRDQDENPDDDNDDGKDDDFQDETDQNENENDPDQVPKKPEGQQPIVEKAKPEPDQVPKKPEGQQPIVEKAKPEPDEYRCRCRPTERKYCSNPNCIGGTQVIEEKKKPDVLFDVLELVALGAAAMVLTPIAIACELDEYPQRKREEARLQEEARRREEALLEKERQERARQAREDRLKAAELAGNDVCWECETINPERCSGEHCFERHCINCVGKCPRCGDCGEYTGHGNSECSACYDDYDD